MPARVDDDFDWSDSDDEAISGVETDVLLGVFDGSVDNEHDLRDVAVSRIGGHPVRVCPPAYMNIRSIQRCFVLSRHFCLQRNHRFLLHTATIVQIQWNSLFRYGAHLKIARWIGLCIFGDARVPIVRKNQGGRSTTWPLVTCDFDVSMSAYVLGER